MLLLTLAMVFSMVGVVSADDEAGSTTLNYAVGSNPIYSIPASLSIDATTLEKTYTVGANVLLPEGVTQIITIESANGFYLVYGKAPVSKVQYTAFRVNDDGSEDKITETNNEVLQIVSGNTEDSQKIKFNITEEALKGATKSGIHTDILTFNVGEVLVRTVDSSDELADALSSDANEIELKLNGQNVEYDVAAWQNNAMGGEGTKTITIQGTGSETLTFHQTNSDWNNIVTNGAKLVIKDVKITNSGYNDGPWNRHDINFACDVELVNVTSDKALAFKANAILNNVTIDDPNTSDTYAIWIQPNGQTIEINKLLVDMIDCTDGRGIKIDEQYVGTPQKVTLRITDATFKTEEKGAILVKSQAGADITLEGKINIDGVAADPDNAVWVDEASAADFDLVTVTGGTKVQE